MRRYALRDDQWDRISDFLHRREGHVGGTAADNRLFVEAVLFRYRAGVPWRDLPERFGDWKVFYQRFSRWAKSGVFERIFKMLASDHDNEYMIIDATAAHFGAGFLDCEHPIDAGTSGVSLLFPCGDRAGEVVGIVDPAVQALAAQHADLDFDHIEPTGVLGSVVEFQALQNSPGFGGRILQRLEFHYTPKHA